MMFGTDIRAAFGLVTDLVNSTAARGGADLLDMDGALDDLAARHSLSYRPEHTRAELAEVRQLRGRLEEFIRLTSTQSRIELINSLLLKAGSTPQLAAHAGDETPHFHYTMDDASFASKVTALSAIGLARLMTSDAVDRFRVCEGQDCDKAFIDVSKNGSRRYCDSQACGNRLHAARYRARKAGEQFAGNPV